MALVARTTNNAELDQRTESRLRELDRRVTTVLTQDTSWPRGLIGRVASTTTKSSITSTTNLLGLTVTLEEGRTYRFESQLGMWVDGASRGLAAAQLSVGGTLIRKASQVLEPFGIVEVATIIESHIPVATLVGVEVLLSFLPDLGLTYGAYAAGNYPLWLTVTDTGPASSVTATSTIY